MLDDGDQPEPKTRLLAETNQNSKRDFCPPLFVLCASFVCGQQTLFFGQEVPTRASHIIDVYIHTAQMPGRIFSATCARGVTNVPL